MASNNQFQGATEKGSGDKGSNGFGMEQTDMTGWTGPGSQPSELEKLRSRESARFADLQSSGAMSLTTPITNSGIVLNGFGGMYGEGGAKPDIQGGSNK